MGLWKAGSSGSALRRAIFALAMVGLIGGGGLAIAQVPEPIVAAELELDLGTPDTWRFQGSVDELNTTPGKTPRLIQDDNDYAVIKTGQGEDACFLDKNNVEWFGNCGSGLATGRVQPGEAILIRLVEAFKAQLRSDESISDAPNWSRVILPLNTKQNVVIDIVVREEVEEGEPLEETMFHLYTGNADPDPGDPGVQKFCAEGSDSTPDDEKGANCFLDIVAKGVEIEMTARMGTGDFSVGGEDEEGRIIFAAIPKGVIDCLEDTLAVGDGFTIPNAICTRLDNKPSTLPGREGIIDACLEVNYILDTSCDGEFCDATLFYGLSGTQDATQLRWLCTFNWTPEDFTFDAEGLSEPPPLTLQAWGPNNDPSNRGDDGVIDFCEGAVIHTGQPSGPSTCEPGAATVTDDSGQFGFPSSSVITDTGLRLDAFNDGDLVAITGLGADDGLYTLSLVGPGSVTVSPMFSGTPTPVPPVAITRLSGCEITGYDFSGVVDGDMSDELPGDQISCLLEQKVTQCTDQATGEEKYCLEQTVGWEGDARARRSQ